MEKEYNLIDEPWICVRTNDYKVKQVNLKDAILNSHNYVELAGETKTQDFAVLRLILAIIYTIFSRYDEDGNEIDILENNSSSSMDRWENIWNSKHIPLNPIEKYLSKWYDRFWLFDDDFPFYQSNAVKGKGKPYSTSKMIGTLFESGNKPRLFSERFHEGRLLSYAEATRWLLHINCFDDRACKPTPPKTWVGQLGLIAIKGDNLFETIMLNYNPEYDLNKGIYESTPSWELDNNSIKINRCVATPNNQAGLLSFMSRRLYLCRENNLVSGYYISGGDYFEEKEVFQEQMTLWKGYKEKNSAIFQFKPKLYDTSKKIWQEFGAIATVYNHENDAEKGYHCSGVIEWIKTLQEDEYNILSKDYVVKVVLASVIYDYGQATSLPVIDLVSDNLTFHSQLLTEIGDIFNAYINEEINKCEKVANQIKFLSENLEKSAGASGDKISDNNVKIQFYDKIDRIFRIWLSELNPTEVQIEEYCKKLENQVYNIALNLGNQLMIQTGSKAIFGRNSKSGISSAESFNIFLATIKKILSIVGDKVEN